MKPFYYIFDNFVTFENDILEESQPANVLFYFHLLMSHVNSDTGIRQISEYIEMPPKDRHHIDDTYSIRAKNGIVGRRLEFWHLDTVKRMNEIWELENRGDKKKAICITRFASVFRDWDHLSSKDLAILTYLEDRGFGISDLLGKVMPVTNAGEPFYGSIMKKLRFTKEQCGIHPLKGIVRR